MKTTSKNAYEPADKQHYKKKYLLRIVEDDEAEKEIKNAKRKSTSKKQSEVSQVQQLDETQFPKF